MKMEYNHIILDYKSENEAEKIGDKPSDFEILQTLGKGAYGFVAKVKSRVNNKIYAMKMMDFSYYNNQNEISFAKNEINIIKSLNHPNIVKYYTDFEEGQRLYIIMEYIDNGDIKGYLDANMNMKNSIPEDDIWNYFYQSLSALTYIHKKNLIHRDIKPANLFFTSDKVIKIGDFGVAKITGNQEERTMIGTPLYMAPEIFRNEGYNNKSDVYSLGCTLYELCYHFPCRMPVPHISSQGKVINDFQDIIPAGSQDISYSEELKGLIKKMTEMNKDKRINSTDAFQEVKAYKIKKLNQYNQEINSSLISVLRCLMSFNCLKGFAQDHSNQNLSNCPITNAFVKYFNNQKIDINYVKDIMIDGNPFFNISEEIDPKDLIHFILKKLHMENNIINENKNPFRIFTLDSEPKIYQKNKIFDKYQQEVKKYFNSIISRNFYGTLEISRICSTCTFIRYYYESFNYLVLNLNEAIASGLSLKDENFIQHCFESEFENYFQILRYCPDCKCDQSHYEKKNIVEFPNNFIIFLEAKNQPIKNLIVPNILNLGQKCYQSIGVLFQYQDIKKRYGCSFKTNKIWNIYNSNVIQEDANKSRQFSVHDLLVLFYSSE